MKDDESAAPSRRKQEIYANFSLPGRTGGPPRRRSVKQYTGSGPTCRSEIIGVVLLRPEGSSTFAPHGCNSWGVSVRAELRPRGHFPPATVIARTADSSGPADCHRNSRRHSGRNSPRRPGRRWARRGRRFARSTVGRSRSQRCRIRPSQNQQTTACSRSPRSRHLPCRQRHSGSGSFRFESWRRWDNCRCRPRDIPADRSPDSTDLE